jgi:hypothetical protein
MLGNNYDHTVFRNKVRELIVRKMKNPGLYIIGLNDCNTFVRNTIEAALDAARWKLFRRVKSQSGHVFANRGVPDEWETFTITKLRNDKVAIKSHKGYLCAEEGGDSIVTGARSKIGEWETWTLEKNANGTVSLRSVNDYYLCAEEGSGCVCNADRRIKGPWEQFWMEKTDDGRVRFKTFDKLCYLCVED